MYVQTSEHRTTEKWSDVWRILILKKMAERFCGAMKRVKRRKAVVHKVNKY